MRNSLDYTGMDCAVAARIRLLPASTAQTGGPATALVDSCVSLQPSGTTPPRYRLVDLFNTGVGAAHPLPLGRDPGVPFVVEIALYAPGSKPCQDDQPLVGLGRSGVVDLRRESSDIAVPIGGRRACETHGNVQTQLLAIEDMTTPADVPPDLALGEIFPYDAFTATSGVCMTPPLTSHRGVFRSFDLTHSGINLDGTWVVDHSVFDGCTVLAGTTNGGRQLSCLFDQQTSKSTLQGFVINAAHLDAVRAFNQSVHASSGALVVRMLDPIDNDPNGSAIGARLNYQLLSTLSEAEYPQDATWTITPPNPTGTTSAGLGVAVIADAPAGPYMITFSDGSTRLINAGGSDDPASVTVLIASAQR